MPDLAELATKKTGPLPNWTYAILVVGGLGVTYYLNHKKGSATPNVASTGTTGNGTVDATGMGTYVPSGAGAGNGTSSGGTGSSGTAFADNNAWGSAAINHLVSLGYDPGLVNDAIANYLASQTLTTQQQAMVNAAIQHQGAPPLLVAPVNGSSPPVQGGSSGTGTMTAPGNVHVNDTVGNLKSIVWDADAASTTYKVDIKNVANGKLFTEIVIGPKAVQTTGAPFTASPGTTYQLTVTPQQGSTAGPPSTITYTAR